MAFWNWLSGGPANAEVPFEPTDLDTLAMTARRKEPAVALVEPEDRLPELLRRSDGAKDGPTLAALAACQLALGQYEEGLETLDLALIHSSDRPDLCANAYRIKGTVLDFYLDEPDKALLQYETAAKLHDTPETALYRAEVAQRNGRSRELKRLLQSVVREQIQGPLGDAEAGLNAGDHGAAFEALELAHHISLLRLVAAVR